MSSLAVWTIGLMPGGAIAPKRPSNWSDSLPAALFRGLAHGRGGESAPARPSGAPEVVAGRYARASMLQPDPDAATVALAQGGDRRAFDLLVVKHQRRVARLVTRYIRSSGDVEEVVQDAFVRAWRGIGSFSGESSFSTWLYRIATNVSLNWLRDHKRENAARLDSESAEYAIDAAVSEGDDPERTLVAQQIARTVQAALDKLPEAQRECLVMYETEGKPYQEIADQLGIPIGTVRARIFRAREFLAKSLEPVLGKSRGRRW